MAKKPVLLILAVIVAFWLYHRLGAEIRNLSDLRAALGSVGELRAAHPLQVAGVFFLAYIAVTALSLPLALWMTLAAGALFGFWGGLVLVSFASTIGATLAFLAARFFLRDWVLGRFSDRFAAIRAGLERDGSLYLFSLRLIPAVPFFMVNLLMGLTALPARTFYWISQLGMLPATIVFVNAGTQLSRLQSPKDILSPMLVLSLVLLGLFPWIARQVARFVQSCRLYARWVRPRRFDRNLIVIGGGAAGLVSAYIAAAITAKVTLIEEHKLGGDCLNYGCVPSKALIRSARLAHQMRHAGNWALGPVVPEFSAKAIFRRIQDVIRAIEPHDSAERYTALGVDMVQGHARLIDPWTVAIRGTDGSEQRLTSRAIVLATGATPAVPALPGLDQTGYLTTDTLWGALACRDHLPRRLAILGGGPIGCEMAQAFARLGVQVSLIEAAPRLLVREDDDVSAFVRASLERDGVQVLAGHKALDCGKAAGEGWIEVEAGGARNRLAFDDLLVAVGRTPRLSGYGLEELGITTDRTIVTNEYLETLYPNIFAAGDVAGPYQFTHTAAHQAWYVTVNALFAPLRRVRADYRVIPATTFTDPEVARVGLSEQEAHAKGIKFEVTRYGIDDLDRAITDGAAHGFVKVLTVPGKDRLLGATIVGEHAGDLLAEFVLAMKQGIGLNKILGTIHSYPTFAEANKFVAGEWRKAHISPFALRLLGRYHAWRRGGE
ncbi:MAG TPA: FAD-dependent oxidoreductase [Paracoccaceae bacterium]|nr:FAD-dependent oxidoreductase [Paracoccaceae bacterium]